jgi:hypothetical protein
LYIFGVTSWNIQIRHSGFYTEPEASHTGKKLRLRGGSNLLTRKKLVVLAEKKKLAPLRSTLVRQEVLDSKTALTTLPEPAQPTEVISLNNPPLPLKLPNKSFQPVRGASPKALQLTGAARWTSGPEDNEIAPDLIPRFRGKANKPSKVVRPVQSNPTSRKASIEETVFAKKPAMRRLGSDPIIYMTPKAKDHSTYYVY